MSETKLNLHQGDGAWCVLCGMSPMPVAVELPDGCRAHPGCASDPVFAARLSDHSEMTSRPFDREDYPHGCRCACCREWFEDGDLIIDRDVAENWTTPTCQTCAAGEAPLCEDHPFSQERAPIMCADGFVR